MRRAARTVAKQSAIVDALRDMGATVVLTHQVGQGFPDAICGWRGRTLLLEVKDGSKPPSKRRLTPDQEIFHSWWRGGTVHVLTSVNAAVDLLRGLDRGMGGASK